MTAVMTARVRGLRERLATRRKDAHLNVVDKDLEGGRFTSSQCLAEAFGRECPDEVHGKSVAGDNAPGWKECGRHRVPDGGMPGERVGPASPGGGPKRTSGSARQPIEERAGDGVEQLFDVEQEGDADQRLRLPSPMSLLDMRRDLRSHACSPRRVNGGAPWAGHQSLVCQTKLGVPVLDRALGYTGPHPVQARI